MKVAVAGDSLAGLMTGIEIRFAGAEVELHERSAGILDDRGAGIVMQPETLQMLTQRCGLAEEESGVRVDYICYGGMIHGFVPMGRLIDSGNRAVSHIAASLREALR